MTAFSAHLVENLPTVLETPVLSLGWEDPLENKRLPTPVFLPRELRAQRRLMGYSTARGIAKSQTRPSY